MAFRWMMKNPVFMIGVILMGLFITSQVREGGTGYRESLTPTSCKAVLVKLDRRIPKTWETKCTRNNLHITMKKSITPNLEDLGENPDIELIKSRYRQVFYRELANDLILLAKNSPEGNLERTEIVTVKLMHPELEIGAMTEGRFVVKFATLTDIKLIMEHLQETVQVQEVFNLSL
jgi:hypothetical protein